MKKRGKGKSKKTKKLNKFGGGVSKLGKNRLTKKQFPTLQLVDEREIAMDFATKVYEKFNKIVKSIILFGSSAKHSSTAGSDIDIIIVVDDASIKWDTELVAWYREELGKIVQTSPYKKGLHINTVKLSTWWHDLMQGDPVIINIIRYGEALIDFAGFFDPLKILLAEGRIHSTPEAIYTGLQRAPLHLARSRSSVLGAIEGLYWAMVDSAHAALISANQLPPSPEHIPIMLKEVFIDKKLLKMRYAVWYRDLYLLHRKILHGDLRDIKGKEVDEWRGKADEFVRKMSELINRLIEK